MVHIVPMFTFHGKKDDKIGTVGGKNLVKENDKQWFLKKFTQTNLFKNLY